VAQTPPPLVSPIPVSSARLDWELDGALDTPALVASRRLPVGEQWSTSILGCVVCLACCISLFSLYCSIQQCSGDVDFDGGVVTWVQSIPMPTQEERIAALEQKTATAIQEVEENTTIMLGVIRSQGQDSRKIFHRLETMDENINQLKTTLNEHTTLLTQILARLPKTL